MFKLDHVVYFTEKSPAEVVEEQKSLSWHSVIGGSHEQWGTYNALMYVNNAYIEWLSIEERAIAEEADHQLVNLLLQDIDEGEGWGTICFSVDGIEELNRRISDEGYKTSGVLHAERKTVTGEVKRWKMLFINEEVSSKLPYPFFIQWGDSESKRFEVLRKDGAILPDNDKLKISECLFSVKNPEQEARKWASLLSVKTEKENTIRLSNTLLKFVELEHGRKKERLSDVVIEPI